MKAFRIRKFNEEEEEVLVAESIEEIEGIEEIYVIEELCDVSPGICMGDIPYYIEGEEEVSYGDYIMETGEIIGDESHTGQGESMGVLDISRTNSLIEEMGCFPFEEWDFSLWVGSYWDGNNWRVVAVKRF